jgi:hypothetical protein
MELQLHLAMEEMSNHRLFKFGGGDVELGGGGTLLLGTKADADHPL